MASRFFSFTVTILAFFFVTPSPCSVLAKAREHHQCHFPAIFNFGDSNSDTGGLSAVFGQARSPHGMSFFGHPAGRYCDGRLVVDFIGGVYKKLLPEPKDFSRALYTFDIGQNDLVAAYFSNMTTNEVKSNVPDIINQFQNVIKYVYGQGGRYFWIHNTGPFGCLAYVLDRIPVSPSEIDRAGCAIPFNEVAQYFNHKLKEAVVQLRKELPSAVITYVDVYSIKYSLFSEGPKHGFKHPLRTCCGHGGKYNYNMHVGCGGKKKIHGKEVLIGKACKDPSTSVIWDGVHYTQAANKYIFDRIADGSFSDPPTPLNLACHKY